jgi:hypothetical protein
VFPSEQGQRSGKEYSALKQKANAILPKLPEAEVQKVALCNLAMGNFDIKWDNAMVETTTDGVKARPFDAGVAVPDLDTFMRLCHIGTVPGLADGGLKHPGGALTLDLNNQPLESATKKMDPGLAQQFQQLDVAALENAVTAEIARLDQSHNTNCAQFGLDPRNAFKVTAECLKATQKLLQDPNMTLEQFVQDYQTEMIDKLVTSKKGQWEPQWTQTVTNQYNQLKQRYPTLVYQGETDPKDMFMNWLNPGQQAYLQQILLLVDPNAANLLTTYPGLKWPGAQFRTAHVALKSKRKDAHVAVLKTVNGQITGAQDDAAAENIAKQALRQANVAFDDSEVAERVKNMRKGNKAQQED